MMKTLIAPAAVAAALAVGTLVASAPATAAPPSMTRVGHVQRHPTATWTLPAGVTAETVEIATRPDVATDGSFFTENVKVFDVLGPDEQGAWTYASQLDPGTYYVHVAGYDEACFFRGECSTPRL